MLPQTGAIPATFSRRDTRVLRTASRSRRCACRRSRYHVPFASRCWGGRFVLLETHGSWFRCVRLATRCVRRMTLHCAANKFDSFWNSGHGARCRGFVVASCRSALLPSHCCCILSDILRCPKTVRAREAYPWSRPYLWRRNREMLEISERSDAPHPPLKMRRRLKVVTWRSGGLSVCSASFVRRRFLVACDW